MADLRRQDLEGDNAIQGLLAGPVNRAHATPADEAQHFKLGEESGELAGLGRDEAAAPLYSRCGG